MPEGGAATWWQPRLLVLVDGTAIPEKLTREACDSGVRVEPFVEGLDAGGLPQVLMGPAQENRLRLGLHAPLAGFVESGDSPLSPSLVDIAARGGLVLSLTTRAAFGLDVSALLGGALANRFHLPPVTMNAIELALSEAVSNALIHGNLGIGSEQRSDLALLAEFGHAVSAGLADPVRGTRRVEVTVEVGPDIRIRVSDQGAGFDLDSVMARPVEAEAKSGRGIGLLRKIAQRVEGADGGRTLILTFSR